MAIKKRVKEKFSRYDTADYLKSEADMVAYLEACMDEAGDDPAFIAVALGNIARAYGMVRLAKDTGPDARRPIQGLCRLMAIPVSAQY